jgi:hypothetical protein
MFNSFIIKNFRYCEKWGTLEKSFFRWNLCTHCASVSGRLIPSLQLRMRRQPRWIQLAANSAQHAMSRGHNRAAIFANRHFKQQFLAPPSTAATPLASAYSTMAS